MKDWPKVLLSILPNLELRKEKFENTARPINYLQTPRAKDNTPNI